MILILMRSCLEAKVFYLLSLKQPLISDLYLLQVWTTGTMGELSPVSLANLHLDFDEPFELHCASA